MPIQRIRDINALGILDDVHPGILPFNAWSAGNNSRFRNNRVEKIYGTTEVYTALSSAPWTLFFIPQSSTFYWVACAEDSVWVHDGSSWHDITKAATTYTADADLRWTGGLLGNDYLVLNNGSQNPQAWTSINTGVALVDLPDWPAETKANCIRPFSEFLVALDVTESGSRYTDVIRWSHGADPKSAPASWDYTNPLYDTGRVLLEGGGVLIDCLSLRGVNIVYGETATWAMQYIGGTFVFNFEKIFNTTGLLSRNCAKAYRGNHVCLTQGDVIIHDGLQPQSLIDGKRRRWIFNQLDPTYYQRSFVAVNELEEEVWVCFPTSGSTVCDKALVIEMRTLACSERDLPNAGHIGYGSVHGETKVIDDLGDAIDAYDEVYDKVGSNASLYSPVIADTTNTKIFKAETGNLENGSTFTSYIERTDIELDNQRRRATITRLYPVLGGSGVVQIYVGGQQYPTAAVDWDGPFDFTIGEAYKVDCRVEGRYHAVKFSSENTGHWELSGYDIEYVLGGSG